MQKKTFNSLITLIIVGFSFVDSGESVKEEEIKEEIKEGVDC